MMRKVDKKQNQKGESGSIKAWGFINFNFPRQYSRNFTGCGAAEVTGLVCVFFFSRQLTELIWAFFCFISFQILPLPRAQRSNRRG